MPQNEFPILPLGGVGLGFGALCFGMKWGSISTAKKLQEELDMMKAMPTSGVDAAVSAAMTRGLGKGGYVELSGQSWTEKPLKTRAGIPALAIKTSKIEKVEDYHWVAGAKTFEETVKVGGFDVTHTVDPGAKAGEGHWVPSVHTRTVEDNTVTAETGVCFRQLGKVDGLPSSPSQVCLNLDRCKVQLAEALQSQEKTTKFEPNLASNVNITINTSGNSKQKPPAKVLGWETNEQTIPMGKEVYALGNVAWRQAASVGGIQGQQGALAILQPAAGKPFIFGFGSEEYFQEQRENSVKQCQSSGWLLDKMGYAFMGLGGLALAAGLVGKTK